MNDLKAKILELRKSKVEANRRTCIGLLETFLATNPGDVEAWYAKAGCHDFLGEEQAALPCYHKVYAIGWRELPEKDQPSFFVGYGSTLRNNLAFDESSDRLAESIQHFPNYPALKVFQALSLYSQAKVCGPV